MLEIVQSLVCVQTTLADEVVEELSSFDILEDEVSGVCMGCTVSAQNTFSCHRSRGEPDSADSQFRASLPYVVQSHDIGVLDEFHNDNLALDA